MGPSAGVQLGFQKFLNSALIHCHIPFKFERGMCVHTDEHSQPLNI